MITTIDVRLPNGVCHLATVDDIHYLPVTLKDIDILEKFTSNEHKDIVVTLSTEYPWWAEVKPYFGSKGGLFQVVTITKDYSNGKLDSTKPN